MKLVKSKDEDIKVSLEPSGTSLTNYQSRYIIGNILIPSMACKQTFVAKIGNICLLLVFNQPLLEHMLFQHFEQLLLMEQYEGLTDLKNNFFLRLISIQAI